MPLGTLGLAFLAGVPLGALALRAAARCPIVLGTAASEHRLGPLALAAGLAISFTDHRPVRRDRSALPWVSTRIVFRTISAILLIGVGLLLLVPRLQEQFAVAAGPVSQWAGGYLDNFAADGPRRPVRSRAPARRGVEPMRRPDARRRLAACRQGRESRPGGADHARLRHRRRSAADAARLSLARSDACAGAVV